MTQDAKLIWQPMPMCSHRPGSC